MMQKDYDFSKRLLFFLIFLLMNFVFFKSESFKKSARCAGSKNKSNFLKRLKFSEVPVVFVI